MPVAIRDWGKCRFGCRKNPVGYNFPPITQQSLGFGHHYFSLCACVCVRACVLFVNKLPVQYECLTTYYNLRNHTHMENICAFSVHLTFWAASSLVCFFSSHKNKQQTVFTFQLPWFHLDIASKKKKNPLDAYFQKGPVFTSYIRTSFCLDAKTSIHLTAFYITGAPQHKRNLW